MTYGDYTYGSSYEDGIQHYNTATDYIGQGRRDDARSYLELARNIFMQCSQTKPEAARYLQMVEDKLRNLG